MWNGGVVAAKSFIIKLICTSTCEAEFVAMSEGCKRMRELAMFCEELGFPQKHNPVFCDNDAAVQLAKDIGPSRGKHIDVRYHFIKDHERYGYITVTPIGTELNPADMGTKIQPKILFVRHREMMGLIDISSEISNEP